MYGIKKNSAQQPEKKVNKVVKIIIIGKANIKRKNSSLNLRLKMSQIEVLGMRESHDQIETSKITITSKCKLRNKFQGRRQDKDFDIFKQICKGKRLMNLTKPQRTLMYVRDHT